MATPAPPLPTIPVAALARYRERLVALARSKLSPALARRVDPEDVAQSVFRSFCRVARQRPDAVRVGEDLWDLLAAITLHKVLRAAERNQAGKRDLRCEHPEAFDGD